MQTIGDQRRGPDLPADPDPVAGDDLVPQEPDDRCGCHRGEMTDLLRVQQPVDGLVSANTPVSTIIAITNRPPRSSARPKPWIGVIGLSDVVRVGRPPGHD